MIKDTEKNGERFGRFREAGVRSQESGQTLNSQFPLRTSLPIAIGIHSFPRLPSPKQSSINAYIRAISFKLSNLPELPPWPASIFIFKYNLL